ncbi:hypothetical protein ZYGR_0AF04220 [Zygosaccharomyces rouxii]|uniref:Chitin biosynthesis protein CHS5 n=1 Tax=Zygosaccharomyces rouxii TaxID=4956 RepID=A0A1Q3A8P6_ZYGRO|nr:hypothetical protein ZYGR_0AF04220 [Zygosaccharomyces rouxii]
MSDVEVLLTVGKLDASLALLTTQDHHVIEFPTMLLPDNVKAGSIVKLSVSQNLEEEKRQRRLFKDIQMKILEKYGTEKPKAPVLKIVNVTQTSCVLAWDPLSLGSARLKSLILYRQGVRSMVIPSPLKTTTTKISGLSVDTDYEFQLKLSTTSGQYWSEKIKMHTHKMTDMSGITVCLGHLDPLQNVTDEQIAHSLEKIGARPMQKHAAIDTTHFVTNEVDNEDDPELARAKSSNIPIVRPEWVRACEIERRIVGVRGFYLDADPGILKSYQFPKISGSKVKFADKAETLGDKKEEEATKEATKEAEQVNKASEEPKTEENTKQEGEEIKEQETQKEPTEAKDDLDEDKLKQAGEAATETINEVKDDVPQSDQNVSEAQKEGEPSQAPETTEKVVEETQPQVDGTIQANKEPGAPQAEAQAEAAYSEAGEPKEAAFEEKVDVLEAKETTKSEETKEETIEAKPDAKEEVPEGSPEVVNDNPAEVNRDASEAKPEEVKDETVEAKKEATGAKPEEDKDETVEAKKEATETKPEEKPDSTASEEGIAETLADQPEQAHNEEPKTEVMPESKAEEPKETPQQSEPETAEAKPSEAQHNAESSQPNPGPKEATPESSSKTNNQTPTPASTPSAGGGSSSNKKNKKKNKNKKK